VYSFLRMVPAYQLIKAKAKMKLAFDLEYHIASTHDVSDFKSATRTVSLGTVITEDGPFTISCIYLSNVDPFMVKRTNIIEIVDDYKTRKERPSYQRYGSVGPPPITTLSPDISKNNHLRQHSLPSKNHHWSHEEPTQAKTPRGSPFLIASDNDSARAEDYNNNNLPNTIPQVRLRTESLTRKHIPTNNTEIGSVSARVRYEKRSPISTSQSPQSPIHSPRTINTPRLATIDDSETPFTMETPATSSFQSNKSGSSLGSEKFSGFRLSISPFRDAPIQNYGTTKGAISPKLEGEFDEEEVLQSNTPTLFKIAMRDSEGLSRNYNRSRRTSKSVNHSSLITDPEAVKLEDFLQLMNVGVPNDFAEESKDKLSMGSFMSTLDKLIGSHE